MAAKVGGTPESVRIFGVYGNPIGRRGSIGGGGGGVEEGEVVAEEGGGGGEGAGAEPTGAGGFGVAGLVGEGAEVG